jgi:hypothetical protein
MLPALYFAEEEKSPDKSATLQRGSGGAWFRVQGAEAEP